MDFSEMLAEDMKGDDSSPPNDADLIIATPKVLAKLDAWYDNPDKALDTRKKAARTRVLAQELKRYSGMPQSVRAIGVRLTELAKEKTAPLFKYALFVGGNLHGAEYNSHEWGIPYGELETA